MIRETVTFSNCRRYVSIICFASVACGKRNKLSEDYLFGTVSHSPNRNRIDEKKNKFFCGAKCFGNYVFKKA